MKEEPSSVLFFIGQKVEVTNNGFHIDFYGPVRKGEIKVIANFNCPTGHNERYGITFTDGSGGHCNGEYRWYLKPLPPERVVNHEVWYN